MMILAVSRASSEWGLYLRLEDVDDTALALADDGQLSREGSDVGGGGH